MSFANPAPASGASLAPPVRSASRDAFPRFRPNDFRPLSHTASEYHKEIARLDRHEADMLAERDRLLAKHVAMMGARIDPAYLDANDRDRAALATDLGRLTELRAQLQTAVPVLEAQEAAELARALEAAERCRARVAAFRAKAEATYAALAEPLAALLKELAAIAGERAAAVRAHAVAAQRAEDGVDFGPAPALHRGVLLRALDGKTPLFDGRVFHREIPTPHGTLAIEVT